MQSYGAVATFDERRGLGAVESSDGTRYEFHCTAIADGTRTVAPDAAVSSARARPGGRTGSHQDRHRSVNGAD